MCVDPATMAIIGMVGSAVSTGMSVIGSLQQGKAAQAQANYQAKVQENNAKAAQMQAADAIERGKLDENNHRKKVAHMLGAQRAGIAGSGFELGDETSQDILGDTAAMGELDARMIRTNAAREAWGFEYQASNELAGAEITKARGESARIASFWNAGTDLLGGATKFATSYGQNAKQFGWGSA